MPKSDHLSIAEEKTEYDLHQNNLEDEGYLSFLSRLSLPLLDRVSSGRGLDFGCGPAPALAKLLEQGGLQVELFDKFYFPKPSVLTKNYRFITASEVIEHLDQPGRTLDELWHRLEIGGHLGLMTKRWSEPERFSKWHYKNDPTHISFFHLRTFEWLATRWQARLEVCGPDVVIFMKLQEFV